MKIKLQTMNESGDGFNERMIDCGDGDIGEQLMSFLAQSKPTEKITPAAPPDGIKHRAPVDADGCPIQGALPPQWDSNASTWGVNTKGEGWGPPFFDAEVPPDIDWAIVAREFETCGLPTRLKNNS